jgi:predicted DNA-binding protein (MmcQ/YjbR family)
MMDIETLRQIALSFPETTEKPHFEKTSFRVKNKIFATYDSTDNQACIKLSEIDQNVFSLIDKDSIYPVPNKWGKQGWTFVKLNHVKNEILTDTLTTAYCEVAPKKLSEQVKLTFVLNKLTDE